MSLLLWFSILTLKINYTCEGGNAHLTRIPGFQKHICCYPLNYHCKVCEVDFTTFLKLFSWTNIHLIFVISPFFMTLFFSSLSSNSWIRKRPQTIVTIEATPFCPRVSCHVISLASFSKGFYNRTDPRTIQLITGCFDSKLPMDAGAWFKSKVEQISVADFILLRFHLYINR